MNQPRIRVICKQIAAETCVCPDAMDTDDLSRDPIEVLELLNKLGEGSYGSVVKARHKRSGDLFAVKCAADHLCVPLLTDRVL